MSNHFVPEGDFSGWSQVCDHPGGAMAWNWPPMFSLDYARNVTFLAVAIGLFEDHALAIRTPSWVPGTIVQPLQSLVMREQAAGVPIAISLTLDHDLWSPTAGSMALVLHSTDRNRLNGYFSEMAAIIARNRQHGFGAAARI